MNRIIFCFLIVFSCVHAQKLDKIVISGPIATVSHPILKMIEDEALNDIAKNVEFRLWQNPDELRSMLLKKEVDFVALPTNVAANLYNKNQPVRIINVPVWGILEILSRDETVSELKDLKGEEIIVPFRADMPDIVLQAIIKQMGMDHKKDFKLKYVPTPPDAMQLLLLRKAKHVLLIEPATSMIMRKTGSFPISLIAPNLYRSVDLEEEWGKAFNTKPRIPEAGIAVLGDMDPKIIKRFNEEYKKALNWCKDNPKEAGELVAKQISFFTKEAISDSFEHVELELLTADESKEELNSFFNILLEIEPKLIGGKIPNDDFYAKETK
ncbi:MAG: ABC transporter substrate-binding protein [Campylobacteraceae bacterium]|nr:ABC transporter substrate-binding protein [Campylobacteraceae bacterium]